MINSQSLDLICDLPINFHIGPIVYDECTKQPCAELEALISKGKILMLDPNIISVTEFATLSTTYKLGDGETECIAYGKKLRYLVCSDDRKARASITKELGENFLSGSIGLLKTAKEKVIITCLKAFDIYSKMKEEGAFLPYLPTDYFCPISKTTTV